MKQVTVTMDPDDDVSFDPLAKNGDVTASWRIRLPMRGVLERYGEDNAVSVKLGEMRQGR